MTDYCESADLYDHGLPRGGLANPGRLIASVSTDTNVVTLDGHGFRSGAALLFRAEAGGSLPSPLVAGTTYYALPLTDSTFQVAATEGGDAIDLTTAGSNTVVSTPLAIGTAITWASAQVDDFLPAHVVPMTAPYPPTVVAVTAALAIAYLLTSTGSQSAEYIALKMAEGQKMLERWAKGIPLRGTNAPAPAGLAAVATSTTLDPRGWIAEEGRI